MARMDMMVADLSSKLVSLLDGTRADEHQRIRLEALHAASRARGRSSKEVVASLFCADLDRLRFILAGACAPNFILGTVKQQKKDASEATKAGLVRPRTLLFGKLPKEINHEAAVKSLLSQAGLPCSGFRKLAPERALVELACHTMDPPDEEILGEDRKGVHSRHNKHMTGSGSSSLVRGPLVQDMRFYAKLVLQLFMSERRKLVLPNPNFRPGGSAPPEVTITGISAERPVAWSLGATGTRVHPYWRSNVGSTSDFNEAYQFRFGVALSFLGTENERAVRALGVTLLPAGLFSKVLQLIFTPPDQPLRICCSMDRTQIYAAKVGPSKVSFAPAALSLSDMAAVNKARKMVSVAIAGEGGSQGSVREIEVTVMALMNLLLRPGGTEDTKESDSGSQRKNWIACELERGTDYLPQISLATAAIFQSASDQQESGGVGGEEAARKERGEDDRGGGAMPDTELHTAAQNGRVADVERLLAAGAAVGASNINGRTPLHCAARYGHVEVAEKLLAAGAAVGATNIKKWTPLHCAARIGHVEVAEKLLAAGAAVGAKDRDGKTTPLHCAARYGHVEVAEKLLAAGAAVGAKANDGETPLHLAAIYGRVEVAEKLLAAGAAVGAKDRDGKTPLDKAVQYNKPAVAALLREWRPENAGAAARRGAAGAAGTDYLPQISLATAAIFQSASDQQESGGVGGEEAARKERGDS
jgi:hypothetical protein